MQTLVRGALKKFGRATFVTIEQAAVQSDLTPQTAARPPQDRTG
jgi:hypothetical protein